MIWVWTASLLLAVILVLATYVQMLYLESLRLRTRDLPALQFFKSDIEKRLGFETEDGALRFSLVKHTALPLVGMSVLAGSVLSEPLTLQSLGEAVVFGWLLMMLSSYLVPQVLYRRTQGKWLVPLLPACAFLAILAAPVAGLLNFLHSLLEIANQPDESEEPATPRRISKP